MPHDGCDILPRTHYRGRPDRRCNLRADSEASSHVERDRDQARLIGISSALVTGHHWRPRCARSGAAGMMREGPTMAAHDALRTLLPIAGWPEERARSVEITGGADPVLPTPFRIGETSAAGLAAADLWELRSGRRQEVAVDLRQATASLRSGHYLKMEQAQLSHERNPVM